MAKKMQSVDLDSSTVSTYSCFERNLGPVGGFPFTSSFLNNSQRGPIIEITFDEEDEEQVSSFPRASSVGVDVVEERDQQTNPADFDPLTCRVCKKKFTRKDSLAIHMNLHSQNPVIFPCKICDRPFKNKSNSKKHEYIHMNRKELKSLNIFHAQCRPCLQVFFQRRDYEVHMNMHENFKPLECQECDKKFVTNQSLNRHLLSQHGDEEAKKKLRDSWKFKCNFPNCTAKFSCKSHLENHSHSHSTKKEFKCTKCDKYFQTPKSRRRHAKVHKVNCRFKCYFCHKNFSTTQDTNRHMKTHVQEFEFKCEICGKEFIQKVQLTAHMSGVHEGPRPHPCPHCPNPFLRPSALTKHLKHCINFRQHRSPHKL